MSDGRYNESIILLNYALQGIMPYLEQSLERSPGTSDGLGPDENFVVVSTPIPNVSNSSSESTTHERIFPLFNSGLIFSSDRYEVTKCTNNGRRATVALLYNAGLAYHLMGIGREDKRTCLVKALCYYELASSLLLGRALPTGRDVLLGLAIVVSFLSPGASPWTRRAHSRGTF